MSEEIQKLQTMQKIDVMAFELWRSKNGREDESDDAAYTAWRDMAPENRIQARHWARSLISRLATAGVGVSVSRKKALQDTCTRMVTRPSVAAYSLEEEVVQPLLNITDTTKKKP
jgi:hypothetical protein